MNEYTSGASDGHAEPKRLMPCPACGSLAVGNDPVYQVDAVPTQSCLLLETRQAAIDHSRGNIELVFCADCGHLFNRCFNPTTQEFSPRYEPTQHFSPTFVKFADELVDCLVNSYDIREKRVLEIGCGKGEFLDRICVAGNNVGLGVDPSYDPDRDESLRAKDIRFLQESYHEDHAQFDPDVVCCRHTFEHIRDTGDFLETLTQSLGDRRDRLYFFEVPDATRVLREGAFWDIYYEHCNYFTPATLSRQFRLHGFEILQASVDYESQYIVLMARLVGDTQTSSPDEKTVDALRGEVETFSRVVVEKARLWNDTLDRLSQSGRVAIWGGASKGVAFLTTLGVQDSVDYAVDINPLKRGRFMPGSGHQTLVPDDLVDAVPEHIIVMNPVYEHEIQGLLDYHGIESQLHFV